MSDETTFHVRQAIAGDDESTGWLVARLGPLLRSQASYRLGQRLAGMVDPDDLVAEAWLATLPKLNGIEIRGERATPILLGYVSKVIRNLANQRLRDFLRRGEIAERAATERHETPSLMSAESISMAREESAAVERCLANLSSKEREIIILRAIEGCSNGDVARDLGLEPKTASKRYRRAIEKLRGEVANTVVMELPLPDDDAQPGALG